MTDRETGATPADDRARRDATPEPESESGVDRLGNPTRLTPRLSRPANPIEPEPVAEPVELDPYPAPDRASGPFASDDGPPPRAPFPGGAALGPMFAPRSFGGGRFQVFGCSPGCLVVSLLGSLLLTFLLNAMF